jgi:hypothetical protein
LFLYLIGMQEERSNMSHQPEEISARLSTHEEVCAFRYETINARLKRLEGILIGAAGAILLLLLSIVLK